MKRTTPWMLVFIDRDGKFSEWNKGYRSESDARKVMSKHIWKYKMFVIERGVFNALYN